MKLNQIKPTTISLALAALVMLSVGTYTENGGFQLAGVILMAVVLITGFKQARDKDRSE